ncbi:flavin monoamine oxidase family protein [Rhodosalinus sp. 5P4]|uniref:flavin monoamine oxidase family protein n=1 Tax=Rhodosalinus sp. 5P4 TaxID=3239196 RepID=UPI003523313B
MRDAESLDTTVAIVGGGLSGVALAARLAHAGIAFRVFEAGQRFGGRIAALDAPGGRVDLGPSWFWPGQPRLAQLIADLGLRAFPQHSEGEICLEDARGRVHRGAGFASMQGALRIDGGTVAVIDGLVARLPADRLHLDSPVRGVERDAGIVLADGRRVMARHVVLALPPRLAAGLRFEPGLPGDVLHRLDAIPTWMAGHGKFVAVYDRPFWREAGLSGDAMSRHGPLAEIHDASGADGRPAALFGFLGVPAAQRFENARQIEDAALGQLSRIFGSAAASPVLTSLKDWAFDPLAATGQDHVPPQGHPAYGLPAGATDLWGGRLHFAVTETAPEMGGLMEGALASAERAASAIIAAQSGVL